RRARYSRPGFSSLALRDSLPISLGLLAGVLRAEVGEDPLAHPRPALRVGQAAPHPLGLGQALAGHDVDDPQHLLVEDHHAAGLLDRKSTRLNSSHVKISYAVFCL